MEDQPDMSRYQRVVRPKSHDADKPENEIRVQASGRLRNYAAYAEKVLTEKVRRG